MVKIAKELNVPGVMRMDKAADAETGLSLIQVRFERKAPTQRVVVYYKGERMGEARPLNAIANDRPAKKPGSHPDGAANQPDSKPSTPNP